MPVPAGTARALLRSQRRTVWSDHLRIPLAVPPHEAVCEKKLKKAELGGLLYHLIGQSEHRRWNFEPERLGGPQVDHKIELRRLRHWKVARTVAA